MNELLNSAISGILSNVGKRIDNKRKADIDKQMVCSSNIPDYYKEHTGDYYPMCGLSQDVKDCIEKDILPGIVNKFTFSSPCSPAELQHEMEETLPEDFATFINVQRQNNEYIAEVVGAIAKATTAGLLEYITEYNVYEKLMREDHNSNE